MCYINYYSHQDVFYFVLAFGYIKISFKPITSKTETWTVFTALCLKKQKTKTHVPQKRGGNPSTMSLESLYLVPWELRPYIL